jgi:hypothetical protein
MKIKAKIEISEANADLVVIPLMPDNMDNMNTVIKEKGAVTYFEADKIGSLIASVDDYLMNAKVAQDMAELVVCEEAEGKRKKKEE